MATWHQARRPVRLWSDTEWNVVTDPQGGLTTITSWSTKDRATEFLANLRANGDTHSYILPPARQQS